MSEKQNNPQEDPMASVALEKDEKEQSNLAEEIRPLLTPELFKKFQMLLYYMRTSGLILKEACELADIPEEEIKDLIEVHGPIKRAVQIQELVFKKALLFSIAQKAKTDPRYAQWLMERRYDDYKGPSKSKDDDSGDDVLAEAFDLVLSKDAQQPMVKDVPPPPPPPDTPKLTKDDMTDLKKTISDVLNDA